MRLNGKFGNHDDGGGRKVPNNDVLKLFGLDKKEKAFQKHRTAFLLQRENASGSRHRLTARRQAKELAKLTGKDENQIHPDYFKNPKLDQYLTLNRLFKILDISEDDMMQAIKDDEPSFELDVYNHFKDAFQSHWDMQDKPNDKVDLSPNNFQIYNGMPLDHDDDLGKAELEDISLTDGVDDFLDAPTEIDNTQEFNPVFELKDHAMDLLVLSLAHGRQKQFADIANILAGHGEDWAKLENQDSKPLAIALMSAFDKFAKAYDLKNAKSIDADVKNFFTDLDEALKSSPVVRKALEKQLRLNSIDDHRPFRSQPGFLPLIGSMKGLQGKIKKQKTISFVNEVLNRYDLLNLFGFPDKKLKSKGQ